MKLWLPIMKMAKSTMPVKETPMYRVKFSNTIFRKGIRSTVS